MDDLRHVWAVVLAGGDGSRVRSFFKDARGRQVPKQFCPFDGQAPLVRQAIDRALHMVSIHHLIVALTDGQREWWEPVLSDVPVRNLVVQPSNKGTAVGLLLPILDILQRDPRATIVAFPSDHFVADEERLCESVVAGLDAVHHEPDRVALLGIIPQEPDADYGWILPGEGAGFVRRVARFVEKPDQAAAGSLLGSGALLNSLILVCAGRALLQLYTLATPELVDTIASWKSEPLNHRPPLETVYRSLPSLDFSRRVLERFSERLSVVRVPNCGWTDLGTPERLRQFRATHVQQGSTTVDRPLPHWPRGRADHGVAVLRR